MSRTLLAAALALLLPAAALAEPPVPAPPRSTRLPRAVPAPTSTGVEAPTATPLPGPVADQAVPAHAPVQQKKQGARPRIEVAFVLDTTGSMGGLLEAAKEKIFTLANRIASGKPTPEVRVALVAYRDVGDAYVTRRFDFTGDLDTVFTHLRGFQADGGGDGPEHVGRALGEAVSQLGWSQDRDTMRLVFLVGDAPPARREPKWDFRTWVRAAKEKRIVVHAVRCGGDASTEEAWRYAARTTDGTFETIGHSGGVVAVATPYDAELSRLNAEIAARTVYAGGAAARRESEARNAAVAALSSEAAAERVGFLSKTRTKAAGAAAPSAAPAAVAGAVDLTERPEAVAQLADDALPDTLRSLPKAEREAHVKRLSAERKALEARAAEVAAERDGWRAKNVATKADAFDDSVMKGVKKQAEAYGVAY